MFIRIVRQTEEVLLNIDHISRMVVDYAVPDSENEELWKTSINEGATNPKSVKFYVFTIGGEKYRIKADPDSKVCDVLESIYINAVKD